MDLAQKQIRVRHLVDFTLLVNKKGKEIDWLKFLDRCKKYGIYKFVLQVMLDCDFLSDMTIPNDIEFVKNENKSYLDEFIRDVFESGVHGKHDFVSSVASEFAYTADKGDGKNQSSFLRYIRFLFPKVESMSDTYNYAKKYKVLTPVAWGHHLVRGVCNQDYSFKKRLSLLRRLLVYRRRGII